MENTKHNTMSFHLPKSKFVQFTTSTPTVNPVPHANRHEIPASPGLPGHLHPSPQTPSPVALFSSPRYHGSHKVTRQSALSHLTGGVYSTSGKPHPPKNVMSQDVNEVRRAINFDEKSPGPPDLDPPCTPLRTSPKTSPNSFVSCHLDDPAISPSLITNRSDEEEENGGYHPMEDFLSHSLSFSRHRCGKVEQLNKSLSMQNCNVLYLGNNELSPAKDAMHSKSTHKRRFQVLSEKLEIIKATTGHSDSMIASYKHLETLTPGSTTTHCPNNFDLSSNETARNKIPTPAENGARSLLPDSSFFNSYRIMSEFVELKEINTSYFAVIYRARNRWDAKFYCLKRSKSDYEPTAEISKHDCVIELSNEIAALSSLSHDNIIRYYSSWREMEDTYIQLDYCPGGSLFTFLWPTKKRDTDKLPSDGFPLLDTQSSLNGSCELSLNGHSSIEGSHAGPSHRRHLCPPQLRNLMGQMVQAVIYLQTRGIIHADLKPSNILVDLRDVRGVKMESAESICHQILSSSNTRDIIFKMSDFGRACLVNGKLRDGDGRFLPLLTDRSSAMEIALGRDIYALGVSLFEASGGDIPEYHTEEHRQLKEFGKLPDPHGLPSDLHEVVQRMVSPQAYDRPSIHQLYNLPSLTEYVRPPPLVLPTPGKLSFLNDSDNEPMETNQELD